MAYVARKFPGADRFEAWTRFLDMATLNSDLYWAARPGEPLTTDTSLDRLAKRFPVPEAVRRWRRMIEALASYEGVEDPLAYFAREALLAVSGRTRRSWTPGESAACVQEALNREVPKALLGPDWRRRWRQAKLEVSWTEAAMRQVVERAALAQAQEMGLELDLLIPKANLSPKQTDVIALRREGYWTAEIARRLHMTPATVRVQQHRALHKLRRTLHKLRRIAV